MLFSQLGLAPETQTAGQPHPAWILQAQCEKDLSFLKAPLRRLQADAHKSLPDRVQMGRLRHERSRALPKGPCWSGLLTHTLSLSSGPWLGPAHRPHSPCTPKHLLCSLRIAPGQLFIPLPTASGYTLKMRCLTYLALRTGISVAWPCPKFRGN